MPTVPNGATEYNHRIIGSITCDNYDTSFLPIIGQNENGARFWSGTRNEIVHWTWYLPYKVKIVDGYFRQKKELQDSDATVVSDNRFALVKIYSDIDRTDLLTTCEMSDLIINSINSFFVPEDKQVWSNTIALELIPYVPSVAGSTNGIGPMRLKV